ncbi:uncharacterized protein MYCFIDRAFT_180648 [Pseudocercospora fijiensis CIRAD86]|uniref:Uncharacterized protein n=1 Tax=Pseudocercospora fijiensis (strain CIRAD86) TaxID=383855 RepID=M3AH56_PSEFD|nr:uncharacterized protein MYCFIDRAFT_180648 [Pseudocercospora fijiensis CIRAD86]EME76827.1 hypothetical protein MYCFIDRAFT_180648 [Pseudocercospora fijiensis CIRAD86]
MLLRSPILSRSSKATESISPGTLSLANNTARHHSVILPFGILLLSLPAHLGSPSDPQTHPLPKPHRNILLSNTDSRRHNISRKAEGGGSMGLITQRLTMFATFGLIIQLPYQRNACTLFFPNQYEQQKQDIPGKLPGIYKPWLRLPLCRAVLSIVACLGSTSQV